MLQQTHQPTNTQDSQPPQKEAQPLPLEATEEELLACQLSSWFPTFRHLPPTDLYQKRSNVTIKSKIISNLPDDFIEFLLSDGIRLPQGATILSSCAPNEAPPKSNVKKNSSDTNHDNNDVKNDEGDDENSVNWDEESDEEESSQYSFPELNQQLTEAIAALGGSVIPKLNWSAPKDATWVNEGTLKCCTPGDIYLLVKSSDFCMHDLQVYKNLKMSTAQPEVSENTDSIRDEADKVKLELVLRKWCTFYPSMEFRCFVRKDELSKFELIESCPELVSTVFFQSYNPSPLLMKNEFQY